MVGAAPVDVTVDTTGFAHDADPDTCNDLSETGAEPDVVLSFTPTATGDHTITIPDYVDNVGASIIYVKDGCDVGGICIGTNDFLGPPELTVALTAGVEYSIIVTSYDAAEVGANTFHIEGPSLPQ